MPLCGLGHTQDLVHEMERRGVQNFAGAKYTGLYQDRAFPDLMRCNAYKNGKYEILGGREEVMAEALAVGTKGFIGSQFNFAGDVYFAIHQEQDLAKRAALQLAAIELLYIWINASPPNADGNKAMIEIAGVPVGPPRMPKNALPDDLYEPIRAQVREWCASEANGQQFDFVPKVCQTVNAQA